MYFILFDKGSCQPVGTSRVVDPNFLCVEVSQKKFVEIVSEPFRIQRQVLVKTSRIGEYEVKESVDFIRSNLALSVLRVRVADVQVIVDGARIRVRTIEESYPLNLSPVEVIVFEDVYKPVGEFSLGKHDRPEHKLAVPGQHSFYVRRPFVDFSYGITLPRIPNE